MVTKLSSCTCQSEIRDYSEQCFTSIEFPLKGEVSRKFDVISKPKNVYLSIDT